MHVASTSYTFLFAMHLSGLNVLLCLDIQILDVIFVIFRLHFVGLHFSHFGAHYNKIDKQCDQY